MTARAPLVFGSDGVPQQLQAGDTLVGWLPPPQGRLTLASATPVMTAAVSAAGTVYYTPYLGNLCPVWNGSAFVPTTFIEVSQALSDTAKSPAAAVASAVYDLFGWLDGTTFRVTRGPAWSAGATAGSNMARGSGAGSTALTRVQGVLVNAVAITNGPAANYGTYLGTIATDGSGATVTFNPGSSAAGGGAAFVNIWNAYNRVPFTPTVIDSTASHTYTSSTVRGFDNSATNGIFMVRGLNEDGVTASFSARLATAASSANMRIGIGLTSTSAYAAQSASALAAGTVNAGYTATYGGLPGLGVQYLLALEASDGTNANTFIAAGDMLFTANLRY